MAAELAIKCEVQIAYAIGVAKPVSIMVDTFKTSKVDEEKIEAKVKELFDTSRVGIIRTLDLKRPIYKKTSAYGHFGRRDVDFSWEKTDKAEDLKSIRIN